MHVGSRKALGLAAVAAGVALLGLQLDEGRKVLNFSEWQRAQKEARESAETILEGEMPLRGYVLLHAAARLSQAESQALAQGLTASIGAAARTQDDD